MTDWPTLEHAHGSASDIPTLLEVARSGDEDAWEGLWSCLCHQGTVYSASFAALPELASIAADRPPTDRGEPLELAAAIVAAAQNSDEVTVQHAADVARMRGLTEEALRVEADRAAFVYLLQALLAFEGDEVWGEELDGLAGGEFAVDCPHCVRELYVVIGADGYFATPDDYVSEPDARRAPLVPAAAERLDGIGASLYLLAEECGHPDVATGLTYVFGRATCLECGADFAVADAITG